MARSAGASVQVIAREGAYVTVRLRSGEMRKVLSECRATLGEVPIRAQPANSGQRAQALERCGRQSAVRL